MTVLERFPAVPSSGVPNVTRRHRIKLEFRLQYNSVYNLHILEAVVHLTVPLLVIKIEGLCVVRKCRRTPSFGKIRKTRPG